MRRMSKIIEVRGVDGAPLLGRLRGVTARHELRNIHMLQNPIFLKTPDAHFAFAGPVPQPLPDLLTTSERQLVVSQALAAALSRLDPALQLVPVRLVDKSGTAVASDHVVVVLKAIEKVYDGWAQGSLDGYVFNEIRNPKEPTHGTDGQPLPPLFRVANTLVIGCNDDAAAVLQKFKAPLVDFASYVEVMVPAPAPYLLLGTGREGAAFATDLDSGEPLETGEAMLATWPRGGRTVTMRGAKSRKKLVDFMEGAGAPVVNAKAKAVLEQHGLVDVEFLPVTAHDHGKKAVKGEHWLMHVRATRDYVDVAESDIEVVHDFLWRAREIVVDEGRLADRPPLFRVPGARYPWVFIRSDVVDALTTAKLVGFTTEHPARHSHVVEGMGLRGVS